MFESACNFLQQSLFSLFLRYDLYTPPLLLDYSIYQVLLIFVFIKLSCFSFFRLYRGMWRYTSLFDIYNIAKANFFSTLFIIAFIGYFRGFQDIPRSVFMIDLMLTTCFISISRVSIRLIYTHLINPKPYRIEFSKRVVLIGAGKSGEFICKELLNDPKHRMEPIGFLDDNKNFHGRFIHGKEVLGRVSDLSDFITEYDEALICCPNAPRSEIYNIIEICKDAGKPFKTLPSLNELVAGKLSINQLKEVSIIDLLGRNEISLDESLIKNYIKDYRNIKYI